MKLENVSRNTLDRTQLPLLEGTAAASWGFHLNVLGDNLSTKVNCISTLLYLFVTWSRFNFLKKQSLAKDHVPMPRLLKVRNLGI